MDMEEEVDASVTVGGGLGLRLRLADPSFSLQSNFSSISLISPIASDLSDLLRMWWQISPQSSLPML